MRIFIAALIIAALLQGSFLGINLVLILLICRGLVTLEDSNLYLAFGSGLLLSLLLSVNWGFYPIMFLILVELAHLIDKTGITSNYLTTIPIIFLMFLLLSLSEKVFLGSSFNLISLLLQSVLSLPIYLLVRFWEERFIPSEVRLKLK